MKLQKEQKESADKLEIFIVCPGLSKSELVVSFDQKEGVLEVIGTPKESTLSEIIDLEVSGKITVSPKYRSEKIKLKIENGIAIIELGLAKDVKVITAD